MALSACVYGDGYGQDNFAYVDDQYCDPYNEYDAYYGCDLEYGFANFGYDGGWHQDFYYPGFGFFIFDRAGRRYRMNDYHLGYWGRKRQQFFQSRFSNRSYSGYRLRSFPWSKRNGKRFVRDHRGRTSHRGDRRESRSDDHFQNREDRRQARQDRRDRNEAIDNRQGSDKRDRRNERRATRRSDGNGARAGESGRNDNAQQTANRVAQPPRARASQNRQGQTRARDNATNNSQATPRPPRIKQNQNNQPTSLRDRIKEPNQTIPKDD